MKLNFWKSMKWKDEDTESVRSGDLLYCDDCKFLFPKEHEQINKKEPHTCEIDGRVIKHDGHHPKLPRPKDCIYYERVI